MFRPTEMRFFGSTPLARFPKVAGVPAETAPVLVRVDMSPGPLTANAPIASILHRLDARNLCALSILGRFHRRLSGVAHSCHVLNRPEQVHMFLENDTTASSPFARGVTSGRPGGLPYRDECRDARPRRRGSS